MTETQLLLLPAFVHVMLVMVIAARMGRGRVRAVRSGLVKLGDVEKDPSKWPADLRALSNNYRNQFELPVLFYAVLALLVATGLADSFTIVLSWAFAGTRIVHSFIHTGGNVVIHRFYAFVAGFACLALMWAWFGIRLFVIG
ncbi:MAG: MAPEG family protein [Rhizobiales bacterium]|nr:MAPEG family protein [Hyphomicrobiales bacterium]